MKFNIALRTALSLAASVKAVDIETPICLSAPLVNLEAGETIVSTLIDNSVPRRCEAVLSFADPSFLPVRYEFGPVACHGKVTANFSIPEGTPNGEADIVWHCSGLAPVCNRAVINGGSYDSNLPLKREGQVGCISEFLQTYTTLVTRTKGVSTVTESFPAIRTTSSTSILPLERTTGWPGTVSLPTRGLGQSPPNIPDSSPTPPPLTTTTPGQTKTPTSTGSDVFQSTATTLSPSLATTVTTTLVSTMIITRTRMIDPTTSPGQASGDKTVTTVRVPTPTPVTTPSASDTTTKTTTITLTTTVTPIA